MCSSFYFQPRPVAGHLEGKSEQVLGMLESEEWVEMIPRLN